MRRLVVALGVLATAQVWTPSADAATPVVVALTAQDQYVAGIDGATFSLTVTLSQPLPDDAKLSLTSYKRVSTRQQVRDAAAGKVVSPIDTVLIAPEDATTDGTSLTVTVPIESVSRTKEALQFSASGLYPLAIGVQQDKTVTSPIVTFIEKLPDNLDTPVAGENLRIALVGSVRGPVSHGPDATVSIADSARSDVVDALGVLENNPDLPVALALSPELVQSLGSSDDADAELVARLAATTNLTNLSTTYVDIDPTTATSLQITDTFTDQLRLGEDTLLSSLPDHPVDRGVYLASRLIDSRGAQLVRDLGFRTLLLTHDSQKVTGGGISLMADATRKIEFRFGDDASVDVMLADPSLSGALTRGSVSTNPYLVAQQILAELKALRLELTARDETLVGRSVVLTTDDGSLPSSALVSALVSTIASQSDISFVGLDEAVATTSLSLVNGRPVSAELPVAADASDSELPRQIVDVAGRITGFASMLPADDARPGRWRQFLDVLPDASLDDAERQAYVDIVAKESSAIAASVTPPAGTTFTLGGRDSSIRLTLRNDSDVALTVLVRLSSSKLTFPQGEKTVTLPAGTTTAVEVPVTARSNGRFPVYLTLLTADGSQTLGTTATFTARVNALAGLGQLVTGIALLLLISWWAHHLRTARRQRLAEAGDSAGRHPAGERN